MKIKICGLTKPEEAEYLNRNHVDFAGFVLFYPKSRRNNTIQSAKKIMERLEDSIKKVAVVVSPSASELLQIEEAGFDCIQIHGRLSSNLLEQISLPVWKAFNVKDMAQYEEYCNCSKITGYVFDAAEPGSGSVFDWHLVKGIPRDGKLLMLAGGLQPDNVAEAIETVCPDGVDVSSGVEYRDKSGKDPEKIDFFVRNVRYNQRG